MPVITPHHEGRSVVLIGDFNPRIFQPSWLIAEKLLRHDALEEIETAQKAGAQELIVSSEITAFSCLWVTLQVTKQRFFVSSTTPQHFLALLDLIVGMFTLLRYTPVNMMGVNHDIHVQMPSEGKWHDVGDTLVPKQPWQTLLDRPGMNAVAVQGTRKSCDAARVVVKVQPSPDVKHGVYIHINEHYDGFAGSVEEAMKTLQRAWLPAKSFAQEVMETLLNPHFD